MTDIQPDISIIISNYNYGQFIGEALESVLNQTLQSWECIVIDDGSTDNSVEIIQRYIKRDKRFKFVQLSHCGVSVARNAGLDIARGRYIGFLDSDDCFTEYALEMLLNLALKTNADMVGGAANMVDGDFKFVPSKRVTWSNDRFGVQDNPLILLLAHMSHKWCWLWRRIYKRELIGDTRFCPEFTGLGDDLTFMLDICWRAKTMVESQNITVYHRVHNGTLTNSDFDEHFITWFPPYFKHIQEYVADKYSTDFLRVYYQNSFDYLLRETVIKPKIYKKLQMEGKAALIEACKYIPRKYLRRKQRILVRLLSWLP